ncbi:cadherin-related tumor suppressor-like [Stomoxys calcitrans]|uniref:cadherin-related tumor suppressor-like n=1 Tax=Stomoxys calcitrans TaxID=35570 RepID=UPI0027E2958C|nr:cadherin-related tumor suppressor-like [Stomoxys calcitrans]
MTATATTRTPLPPKTRMMRMTSLCGQVKNLPADEHRQPIQQLLPLQLQLPSGGDDGGEKATEQRKTTTPASFIWPTFGVEQTSSLKSTATSAGPSRRPGVSVDYSSSSCAKYTTAENVGKGMTNQQLNHATTAAATVSSNNATTYPHHHQHPYCQPFCHHANDYDHVAKHHCSHQHQHQHHQHRRHHDGGEVHLLPLFVNSLSQKASRPRGRRSLTISTQRANGEVLTKDCNSSYSSSISKEGQLPSHQPHHHQHHHQRPPHQARPQRRPPSMLTPLVRYALTQLICWVLVISAVVTAASATNPLNPQPPASISVVSPASSSSSSSSLYTFLASNPGRHVYTSAFPRRRTADGTALMQSRAVDTRVQFEVLEGQPKGTVVGFIPTRPDFTYRFNEPPREFTLDQVTGEIKTNLVLDREGMRERYDLVVLSSQPTYPIEVRITVLDVNDNAPEFPEPSIAVSFSESAAKGTSCLLDAATDLDLGVNSVSNNYSIIEGNIDNKFSLAVTTNPGGDVSYLHLETTGDLDRETRSMYRLNISAVDGGKPPKYGYLQVNVSIIDVNDNPPVFDHSDYIVSLNESVSPGSMVLQVMASDRDLGDNSKITYYLAETETQFTVDPETGVISTTEHLNCPQQTCPTFSRPGGACPKSCVFTVFARDHGSPRQDGRAYVTVNLLDTNDHDPMIRFQYFPPTGSVATVDENAANGSVVAAVSVVDMDEGLNGETSIMITAGNELGHFRLDKTPSFDIVRVNGILDREEIGKYNLTVVATDKGTPSRTATSYLIIHVNDVNDHEPVFEKSEYTAILSELAPAGSFVASIAATDEDTGVNALIFYDFVSGNNNQWFAIDSATGLITTQAALDREVEGSVELSISARDGGPNPKWAYTQLKVTILDENDEAPQFTQQRINVSLSEATPAHTLIAMLTANDHDQGTNGSVTYTLASVTERRYPEQFQLDTLTGQLTTRKTLDRELQQNYEILVIARDQGTPQKSSTATVNLHIEDVNDNAPEFYPKMYFHALALPGQQHHNGGGSGGAPQDLDIVNMLQRPLLKVFATDRDEGDNALITYTLNTGGDGLFVVDTWSGSIMFSSKLINAATAAAAAAATTMASTSSASASASGLSLSTSTSLLPDILHHFGKPLYKLHITAKDRGERQSEQDAVVEIVMQEKLQTLEFDSYSQTYEFQLVEDNAFEMPHTGREVGQVQVKQAPLSTTTSSDALEYHIVFGDPEENFLINRKTGMITSRKTIDREQTNQYQLEVVARRGLAYGKCLVHIGILDVNDNRPVFAKDRDDEVNLAENSAVGQEVYIARARDRDSGNNSRITYSLSLNTDLVFRIGPSTGVIYLQKPLKAEPGTSLQLEITATDHGEPNLSNKHGLSIVITDVNDHTPVFESTSYETSLLESTHVNERFFSVKAHDKDLQLNSRLSYQILEGNLAQKFGIFPDGYLFVRSPLDREEKDYYALTVKCQDEGEPQRTAEVPVIIHIIDENDNAPQFTNSSFTFSLPENEPADAFVGKLTASDKDIGRNAELIYTLASPVKDFTIDSRNGFIKALRPFDREELIQRMPTTSNSNSALGNNLAGSQNFILLEAIVADNGTPRLKDKVKIKIIITDVNDNAPEFVRAPYRVQISEGSLVGTQLMRVYTNDLDEGLNGDVYYSLVKGNQEGRFVIDDATGQLSLARKLDREYQDEYQLEVMAKDAAIEGQQLNSTTTITIEVLDENDVAPKFVESLRDITVLETTLVGTELMRFKALDLDLGINAQIGFALTAGNRKDTFHIDSYTGILYLHKPLDYEETTVYHLNITASDGGSPRLSSTTLFTVNVQDENDNPPSFPNTAIVRQIKEGIDLKTPIVTVTAEDPDSAENGKVTYSIVKQDPELPGGRHFGINTQTGVIHTLREIDRETIDTFRLTVVATDQAQKPELQLSAEKLVTVIVEDINDNAPVFVSMNAAILPSKNQQMYGQSRDGALVMQVHATDADSSSNGIVTYELVSGNNELFKLHRNTGAITLRKPIAKPEIRYTLSLKATDEAVQSERKSSDAYITIIATSPSGVIGPVFDQREQSGSVYENEPIGTSILTVKARLNMAEIEYYITNVTAIGGATTSAGSVMSYGGGQMSSAAARVLNERLFHIDTALGILSTAKELDREAGADVYEVEVYAVALGGSPRTTSTKVLYIVRRQQQQQQQQHQQITP